MNPPSMWVTILIIRHKLIEIKIPVLSSNSIQLDQVVSIKDYNASDIVEKSFWDSDQLLR